MSGLEPQLVEHHIPLQPDVKPRRMLPDLVLSQGRSQQASSS